MRRMVIPTTVLAVTIGLAAAGSCSEQVEGDGDDDAVTPGDDDVGGDDVADDDVDDDDGGDDDLGDDDIGDDDAGDDDASDDDTSSGTSVPFVEVQSGTAWPTGPETEEFCTSDSCAELNVEIILSQEDLVARYDEILFDFGPYAPTTIEFESQVAVLSYITCCLNGGQELVVNGVWDREGLLVLDETLWQSNDMPASLTRPFNLVAIPAGTYDDVTGTLTVIYWEEAH